MNVTALSHAPVATLYPSLAGRNEVRRIKTRVAGDDTAPSLEKMGQACMLHFLSLFSNSKRALAGIGWGLCPRSCKQADTGAPSRARVKAVGDLLYRKRGLLTHQRAPQSGHSSRLGPGLVGAADLPGPGRRAAGWRQLRLGETGCPVSHPGATLGPPS